MPTRAHISLYFGATRVYMARYFDGHLAETGADIVFALSSVSFHPTEFLRVLLLEVSSSDPEVSEPKYELVETLDRRTEWFYFIRFNGVRRPAVEIACTHRTPGRTAAEVFRGIDSKNYDTVRAMTERVNADRRQINQQRLALRQQDPGAYSNIYLYSYLKLHT
jgi:hypothetical protein